jgi:DNA polymerase-3 subunit gamma/tau
VPDADGPAVPASLYRRYRPGRFAEVVGQEHVTTALRNAVREGRLGHAYLFSGPRGVGKTTTARLLAKTLNCLDLSDDVEPCGECANCRAIAAGEFYDLVELDAASNRGIDAMRDLIQNVSVGLGATSNRKVYVVDEVHMLTTEASNTLLKTLEEPPAHVVFVLATTDPGKVLPTIRSRTQHFEFTLLDHGQLVGHLRAILEREGVEADEDALDLIARRAAGSDRDALSLLDQALALGGGALDAERVRAAFGDSALAGRLAILDAIAAEDTAGALTGVASALAAGIDPRRLTDDLLRTARDAFVLSASHGAVTPSELTPDDAERLQALATAMTAGGLTRAIEVLGQAIVDIRGPAVPDPRLVLEVAVVRLARRDARGGVDALTDRVERLEREVAALRSGAGGTGSAPAAAEPSRAPATGSAPRARGAKPALGAALAERPASPPPDPVLAPAPASEAPSTAPEPPPAHDLTMDQVIESWPLVLAALSAPVRSQVDLAQPIGVDGDVITFGAPSVHVKRINAKFRENAAAIKQAFAGSIGGVPKLKVVADESFATDLAAVPPTAAGDPLPDDPPFEEPIALDELVDDPSQAPPVDSATRLVRELGATVVDDRPRR